MSTNTTTRPKHTDFDGAGDDLENALTSIEGIADVLDAINDADPNGSNAIPYLTNQLHDHGAHALDAFRRIFGLDQYHSTEEKRSAESEAAASSTEPQAGGDAELLELLALHKQLWRRVNNLKDRAAIDGDHGEADTAEHAERDVYARIATTTPATLAGAIGQLEFAAEWDDPDMVGYAIDGLRNIFGRMSAQEGGQ